MSIMEFFQTFGVWIGIWFIGLVFVQVWVGRDTAFQIRNLGYAIKSQKLAPYAYLLALIVWPITIIVLIAMVFWPSK